MHMKFYQILNKKEFMINKCTNFKFIKSQSLKQSKNNKILILIKIFKQ